MARSGQQRLHDRPGNGSLQRLTADLNGDLSEFGVVDTGELHALVMLFYVALIFIAVLCMGGLAYYYFTRQKYVDAYLKETPDWIVAMQKSGVTL
jgi:hypothetical protein